MTSNECRQAGKKPVSGYTPDRAARSGASRAEVPSLSRKSGILGNLASRGQPRFWLNVICIPFGSPDLVVDLLNSTDMFSETASTRTTDELPVTSASVSATDDFPFGTPRAATPNDFRFVDTLVLTVFSVVYETVVILLRIRSWLVTNSPDDKLHQH
jgi:hypothetical protein